MRARTAACCVWVRSWHEGLIASTTAGALKPQRAYSVKVKKVIVGMSDKQGQIHLIEGHCHKMG